MYNFFRKIISEIKLLNYLDAHLKHSEKPVQQITIGRLKKQACLHINNALKAINQGSLLNPLVGLNKDECGQAITEYSIVLVLFLGVTTMLVFFLRVFSSYGWRILNLIGSDFP